MNNSPKLDRSIRPFSCASLEAALQDYKTGDVSEALHHTLEAAESLASDLVLFCEEGGAAWEYAEDVLLHVRDALENMVDARRYYDQEQDEKAVTR